MATAGQDFGDYGAWLAAAGVDTSLVKVVADKFTASFFCSTDQANNQIASFYTGAMANAGELSFRTMDGLAADGLVIISPNDPGGDGAVRRGVQHHGRALHLGSGPAVRAHGRRAAERRHRRAPTSSICNDYEFELIRQKTGMSEADVLGRGRGPHHHARRARLLGADRRGPRGRRRRAARSHRRSDRRWRRVPRRADEGPGAGRVRWRSRARGWAASRPPGRSSTSAAEPRLHLAGVRARYERAFRPARVAAARRLPASAA